jgi:hypothetical protein
MCEFLSALVFKSGKIFTSPEHTDSHSDLIDAKGLSAESDSSLQIRGWIRVEFTPPSTRQMADVDSYVLRVDESSTPEWFDAAMKFDVTEQLKEIIQAMIVTDERKILLGGCWILAGEAKVHKIVRATVKVALGSSQVGKMLGSSQVGKMLGSSQVGKMLDSSQVGEMWDSSQVGEMWGSSQVGKMFHSSLIPGGKAPATDNRHVRIG